MELPYFERYISFNAFRKKKKIVFGALFILTCVCILISIHDPGSNSSHWSNRELLLDLGKQGSARDAHGHRFKYIGIDGKWIPVPDSSSESIPVSTHAVINLHEGTVKGGYNLEFPSRRDLSRGQSLIIDKILDHMTEGYFLDIGAGDGEMDSISLFFERWRRWTGLLVEASEESFEFLVSKNRRAVTWNTCVQGSNSSYSRQRKEPQCTSISQVLKRTSRQVLDLLSFKVRGHAYDVIKMVDFTRYHIKVICVEFDIDEDERSMEYNLLTNHLTLRNYVVKHIVVEKYLKTMNVIYAVL